MSKWARLELGCHEENCEKLEMSRAACSGCPRNFEVQLSDEVENHIEFARYLLKLIDQLKLGGVKEISGMERLFLPFIKKYIRLIKNEVYARKQKLVNEK